MQNTKVHLEPQEQDYLVVCEKQQTLVKSLVIINLINQYMILIN